MGNCLPDGGQSILREVGMGETASEGRFGETGGFVTGRNAAFDYLRSFGVLLVLLHHAVLAYVTFGFLNPMDPMQTFSPVVDAAKWAGFDRIALVNDTFFMPLLFFVSGLFVWTSLQRRGVLHFLYARIIRLGIPFVVGLLVIIPVAFYPTMLENGIVYGVSKGFGTFWLDYVKAGFNPSGPFWFVWLLLAFDVLAALWYGLLRTTGLKSSRTSNPILDNAPVFAAALIGLSFAAYLPMRTAFAPGQWMGIGPFRMEIVRVFVYLLYFGMGVAVGARGLAKSAFRADGPFAKYWWAWLAGGAGAYGALTWIYSSAPTSAWGKYVFLVEMGLVVLALTALFLRVFRKPVRILDHLSRNSYGMYLLHYLVIIWLQYAVLRTSMPVGAKFGIVFVGGVALCWAATAALRRIPVVRKII
jgi:peptidoglycan/LPS O-acetylase OafA/YrhL